jgi:hypothetical protein
MGERWLLGHSHLSHTREAYDHLTCHEAIGERLGFMGERWHAGHSDLGLTRAVCEH